MAVDVEYFESHYQSRHPDLTDNMWEVVEHLRERCPVAHSDAKLETRSPEAGFWVLTRYEEVFKVLQDWKTFSSDADVRASFGKLPEMPGDHKPPITNDPPIQRDFRRLLNPFLSPQVVAGYESESRRIATELIDSFIEDGHCDLVSQLARPFPPSMFFQVLFGIEDDAERVRAMGFTRKYIWEPNAPDYLEAMAQYSAWIYEFAAARRAGPRRDDVIDALIHGEVEGRPLTEDEIAGSIRILINGGFGTTSDATTAVMFKLVEDPELQDRLRKDPSLIPTVFDEVMRLEPPVLALSRVCTRDVELGGKQLKAGDEVLIHLGAANRDPAEFDGPTEMDTDRPRNRHLSFGGGPHRCIGSNLARLNLRVVFEELLSRMDDIRITEGEAPRHAPAFTAWGLEYLPISFTPAKKLVS